jgi:hypothetical protein
MKHRYKLLSALLAVAMGGAMACGAAQAQAKKQLPVPPRAQVQAPASGDKKPNILVIMATTLAGSTSAPIIAASCPAKRRTSTSWPTRA